MNINTQIKEMERDITIDLLLNINRNIYNDVKPTIQQFKIDALKTVADRKKYLTVTHPGKEDIVNEETKDWNKNFTSPIIFSELLGKYFKNFFNENDLKKEDFKNFDNQNFESNIKTIMKYKHKKDIEIEEKRSRTIERDNYVDNGFQLLSEM